jgi:SAM-dependent methyltransferase
MVRETVGESRFWNPLWSYYGGIAPSMALCRVPELEYAATLDPGGAALDHCCGDGRFAALAWPGRTLAAGCDISEPAILAANQSGTYVRTDVCDASDRLPYPDAQFDLVFNNSALEHVRDLQRNLSEVARVLSPGGTFAFNVLNHRFFDWWPLGAESREAYRRWQPVFHVFDAEGWAKQLAGVGLQLTSVAGYFDRTAARELAWLDCEFSGVYLANRPSRFYRWYRRFPRLMWHYWKHRLTSLVWKTGQDDGAGYFIKAIKTGA